MRERRRTRHRCRERSISGEGRRLYCLDPNGDEKTYGDQGKLKIDELCTTALDGGCEEYKKFGVTRSVIVHYVANAGAGTVEVFLSQFAGDGAYAIYTTRLTGEIDPADEHAARPLAILGFEMFKARSARAWRTRSVVRNFWSSRTRTIKRRPTR